MANRSKQKGYRAERKMLNWLKGVGLVARKVPLSGQTLDFKDDLEIEWTDGDVLRAEVKARKSPPPWLTIKKWLGQADLLFLVEDYEEPLVVMPAAMFEVLVAQAALNMGDRHPKQVAETDRGWD